MRAHWTYLGRAGGEHPRRRAQAAATRDRLVDALSELVEEKPWGEITVDSIAGRADVAHGTLYRHFADRYDVLRAAVERRRAELERERPRFDGPLLSRARERERMQAWVLSVISLKLNSPGLVQAYGALMEESPADEAARAQRRASAEVALASYIRRLSAAGTIAAPRDARRLSRALFTALEGVYRQMGESSKASKDDIARGLAELFDRAIFAPPDAAR